MSGRVTLKVFGHHRRVLPGGGDQGVFDLPAGATVHALLESMAFPLEEVWTVAVNGQRVETSHPLADGDEVTVFCPVSGG